jgi:glycerophosphoryl diester phosphodiesterase
MVKGMSQKDFSWLASRPIAHRGLHDEKLPENSLGAFKKAAASGFAIELDVHCSEDGKVVVIHDFNTSRMTGRDLEVKEQPLKKLQSLNLAGSNYKIPSLRQVLELINGRVPIVIEIKPNIPAKLIGPAVLAELEDYRGKFAVKSFDPRIVGWFQCRAPEIPRGLIAATDKFYRFYHINWPVRMFLLSTVSVLLCRPDFLSYQFEGLPNKLIKFWQQRLKVPLLVWPVCSAQDYKKIQSIGATSVFENFIPGK